MTAVAQQMSAIADIKASQKFIPSSFAGCANQSDGSLNNDTQFTRLTQIWQTVMVSMEILKNKVALVTGGTSGIGTAAIALATAGAKVVFSGRRDSRRQGTEMGVSSG